jgi:hypothetical protein
MFLTFHILKNLTLISYCTFPYKTEHVTLSYKDYHKESTVIQPVYMEPENS